MAPPPKKLLPSFGWHSTPSVCHNHICRFHDVSNIGVQLVSRKFKDELCVYCVDDLATDCEHIFTKRFFTVEQRANLPTAPACGPCNTAKSKLENDLMAVLPFGGVHADAHQNLEEVPKRLAKNQRMHRFLLQGRRKFWNLEPSGVDVERTAYPVPSETLARLFRMITRALVWHHFDHTYLTPEHVVWATTRSPSESAEFAAEFAAADDSRKVSANLGNGTFLYEGFHEPGKPTLTVWRFAIYGGLVLGHSQGALEPTPYIHTFTRVREPLPEDAPATTP